MSKTSIIMDKPSYIVKKDDGVIVCKIATRLSDYAIFNLLQHIPNITKKMRRRFGISYIDTQIVFTAVARHHKTDVWNETLGKRIAEGKCKRNIYKFYRKLYTFVLNEVLNNDIKTLYKYIAHNAKCTEREEQHLKDLMGN